MGVQPQSKARETVNRMRAGIIPFPALYRMTIIRVSYGKAKETGIQRGKIR